MVTGNLKAMQGQLVSISHAGAKCLNDVSSESILLRRIACEPRFRQRGIVDLHQNCEFGRSNDSLPLRLGICHALPRSRRERYLLRCSGARHESVRESHPCGPTPSFGEARRLAYPEMGRNSEARQFAKLLSQSALSQHLARLRAIGVVTFRREAQNLFYCCRSEAVSVILGALDGIYPPKGSPGALTARRVLVVEDDYDFALDVAQSLEAEGAVVLGPVAREEDALNLVRQKKPDLAIVDLNLGKGVSFELVEWLKRQSVPICIVTGYDRSNLRNVPHSLSSTPWIMKPAQTATLVSAASSVIN